MITGVHFFLPPCSGARAYDMENHSSGQAPKEPSAYNYLNDLLPDPLSNDYDSAYPK
jgi:hypothetical protein